MDVPAVVRTSARRPLHAFGTPIAAMIIAGCGRTHWQSYEGPALAREDGAVLRTRLPSLRYGLMPVLLRFDGTPLQRKDVWTKYYEIEIVCRASTSSRSRSRGRAACRRSWSRSP